MIASNSSKFKKQSTPFLIHDVFIPPTNFICNLNKTFEELANMLDKFIFMFENLIQEKIETLNKSAFVALDKEISILKDLFLNLEQKRLNTKEKQEVFFGISDELLSMTNEQILPENKVTKETIWVKKQQKHDCEISYNGFYVN